MPNKKDVKDIIKHITWTHQKLDKIEQDQATLAASFPQRPLSVTSQSNLESLNVNFEKAARRTMTMSQVSNKKFVSLEQRSIIKDRIQRNQAIDDYSFKEKFYDVLGKQVRKHADTNNFKLLRSFKILADSFD